MIRYVAYNQLTRKYEEVDPESEVEGSKVIKQYLLVRGNRQVWVCIPERDDEELGFLVDG